MDPLEVRRTRPAESNVKSPIRESGSQTAGPYVHIGCLPNMTGISSVYEEDLTRNGEMPDGEAITITGIVYDGDGQVSKDIMIEFWHADSTGDYLNGVWRRTGTNLETGQYTIDTIKPGAFSDGKDKKLAPFINVWVTARGINIGLCTRIYFPEDDDANSSDPHLAMVPQDRQHTLIAKAGELPNTYVFDIVLQGENETVFFQT